MSKIQIVKYDIKYYDEWDEFIDNSCNGTIFHKRKFLAYHPEGRFSDDSLMFFTGNHLLAVFPAVRLEKDKLILKSHAGSSYGGIIVAKAPGIALALELVNALMDYAKAEGYSQIEFRTAPKIYDSPLCEELDFAYLTSGFFIESSELSTYYPIADFNTDEDIIESFTSVCRRNTRKALKSGLDVKHLSSDSDIEDFWNMLAENLTKHKATPTHSLAELQDLKHRFPEDVNIIGIYKDNQIIGGITAFTGNKNVVHCFYFASRKDAQVYRPLNIAVLELIKFAASKNIKFINFGISTEKSGTIINHGLFNFKESFGGSGVMRHYWIKEL